MYTYTWYQWLLFFFIYCFVGWVFESTYVSVKKKQFVNRGFLHAPLLPLYGSGAIVILLVSIPVKHQWYLVFLFGALAATALEYVTGVAMEAMFKVRYWDYSHQKFNFQGQICLSSTIAWGALSVLLTEVIHKPVERLVLERIPATAEIAAVIIIFAGFAADTAVSFADAWKLRSLLEKLTELKADIEALQKHLEAASAKKLEELLALKEERLAWIKGHSILKRNPSAVSKKFNDAMLEYKKRLDEWKKERR